MRYKIAVMCIVSVLCISGSVCAQNKTAKPSFKRYEGEITDDMIQTFFRIDTQRRAILKQADDLLRQVMEAEAMTPEQYLTIGHDMRTDDVFLERVRGVAATLVEEEKANPKS